MSTRPKRAPMYLEPAIHKALCIKAAATDRSLSELVGEAVTMYLTEDAEDVAAFENRVGELDMAFEKVVKGLKRSGKL